MARWLLLNRRPTFQILSSVCNKLDENYFLNFLAYLWSNFWYPMDMHIQVLWKMFILFVVVSELHPVDLPK